MTYVNQIRAAVASKDYNSLVTLVPYAQYLGISIDEASGNVGQVVHYKMPFQQHLLGNPVRPSLHGGVIAGFMENVALIDVLISQKQQRIPKPVDFSIDYLRPGRAETCFAMVDIVREGNRIVLARVDCWQASKDTPIAQARVHILLD